MNTSLLESFFRNSFFKIQEIFKSTVASQAVIRKFGSGDQSFLHLKKLGLGKQKLKIIRINESLLLGVILGFIFKSTTLFAENPASLNGSTPWLKVNEAAANSGTTITGWTAQSNTNTFTRVDIFDFAPSSKISNHAGSVEYLKTNTILASSRMGGNSSPWYWDGFVVTNNQNIASGESEIGSISSTSLYNISNSGGKSPKESWRENRVKNTYSHVGVAQKFGLVKRDVNLVSKAYLAQKFKGLELLVNEGSAGGYAQKIFAHGIGLNKIRGSALPDGWRLPQGEIEEMVPFLDFLSSVNTRGVESYISALYGITLDPSKTNYVNSEGTALRTNPDYGQDVSNLGKVDKNGLNQSYTNRKSTESEEGPGQSGKGNSVMSNSANVSSGIISINPKVSPAPLLVLSQDPGSDNMLSPVDLKSFSPTNPSTQRDNDPGTLSNMASATGSSVRGALIPATSNQVSIAAISTPNVPQDCGPIKTFYQTFANTTEGRADVYRYNRFTNTFVYTSFLSGSAPGDATASAYNVITGLVYVPVQNSTIFRVYDPSNDFAFQGTITLTMEAPTVTTENNLYSEGNFVGYKRGNSIVTFDVTGITSFPATVAATKVTIVPPVTPARDYASYNNILYGVVGTGLVIVDPSSGALPTRRV